MNNQGKKSVVEVVEFEDDNASNPPFEEVIIDVDRHGWRRTLLKKEIDFTLTNSREQLFKGSILKLHSDSIFAAYKQDWKELTRVFHDIADMVQILEYLEGNKFSLALDCFVTIDTEAKRHYPQWFLELSGTWISPGDWNLNISLGATRSY